MTCSNCDDCKFDTSLTNIPSDIHEIHVTVETTAIDRFVDACSHIKVKPLVIELSESSHVMTSSSFRGTNTQAIRELWRISDYLHGSGFKIIRKKIECSPTNKYVPSRYGENPHMFYEDGYFESHFAVLIDSHSPDDQSFLTELAKVLKVHKSKNIFKKTEAGDVQMLTYRRSGIVYEMFNEEVRGIKASLTTQGFNVDKVIVEFAWYDTNEKLDDKWING